MPVGFAAGSASRVLGVQEILKKYSAGLSEEILVQRKITEFSAQALETLTSANWRGKMFFPSADAKKSMGLNRIKNSILPNDLFNSGRVLGLAQFGSLIDLLQAPFLIEANKIERMGSFVTRLV